MMCTPGWSIASETNSYPEKRYTLILKDTLLSRDPDSGREQATISWECDFDLPPQTVPGDVKNKTVFIPWSALNPTFRGKLKKDAKPIDLKKVKRFSIMMRRLGLLEHLEFPSQALTMLQLLWHSGRRIQPHSQVDQSRLARTSAFLCSDRS
jgi:hypothetical protein